jgi:hypothetical protein
MSTQTTTPAQTPTTPQGNSEQGILILMLVIVTLAMAGVLIVGG